MALKTYLTPLRTPWRCHIDRWSNLLACKSLLRLHQLEHLVRLLPGPQRTRHLCQRHVLLRQRLAQRGDARVQAAVLRLSCGLALVVQAQGGRRALPNGAAQRLQGGRLRPACACTRALCDCLSRMRSARRRGACRTQEARIKLVKTRMMDA